MDLAGFANIVVPTPINSDSLRKGGKNPNPRHKTLKGPTIGFVQL